MLCIVVIMRVRSTSCLCQGSVEACLCAGLGEQLAVLSPGTISLVGVPLEMKYIRCPAKPSSPNASTHLYKNLENQGFTISSRMEYKSHVLSNSP